MIGSYPRTEAVREDRRKRAEAVQAQSAGLTPQERLAKLDAAGLNAVKERLKLMKLMKAEGDALLNKMQAPEVKKAARELLKATPEQLGAAAVEGAKKNKRVKK